MTTAFVKTALRIKPPQVNEEAKESLKINRNENKVNLENKSMHFDFLYPPYATEQDIYESSIAPLLNRFIEGINITVLSFGQTDMYPSIDDQGMLHQFVYSLFDKLNDAKYRITASCLELYDSGMVDLLAPENKQHSTIKSDNQDWHEITKERVSTAKELLKFFKISHSMTCSHHIRSILIDQPNTDQKNTLSSKFHFVNLHKIQYNQYIPYKDNKLMKLIECNSDTLLFANVCSLQNTQTLDTLQCINQWQTRKNIQEDLHAEIAQLKMEMITLKESNHLEDQVKTLKEEMMSIKNYVYGLTDELTKAQRVKPNQLIPDQRITSQRPIIHTNQPKHSKSIGKDLFKRKRSIRSKLTHDLCDSPVEITTSKNDFSIESKNENNLQLSLENFSFPSCQDISVFKSDQKMDFGPSISSDIFFDEEDTLEALSVPAWSDEGREPTKRTSISADSSLWEDTDSSIATSCMASTVAEKLPISTPSIDKKSDRKQNRKLLRMLHQVQADSLVKKELMGQLEKTEDLYNQMRTHYEDKLSQLRLHLIEVQRERDVALKRKPMSPTASTSVRERPESILQLRENKQAEELRSEYQVKVKQLISENHELRKKNTQITQTGRTAQVKSETSIRQLQQEIESLNKQIKRQNRDLKTEIDGAKEASVHYEREIQQLKRKETMALEAKKKAEDTIEVQNQLIKKRSEETATATAQMRQLINILRKSANAGTFLNEANLEKILNGTFIPTSTNVPPRRPNTH